jgi:hypothetical protein
MRTLPDFKPTIEDNGVCFLQATSKTLAGVTRKEDCKPYLDEMAQFL